MDILPYLSPTEKESWELIQYYKKKIALWLQSGGKLNPDDIKFMETMDLMATMLQQAAESARKCLGAPVGGPLLDVVETQLFFQSVQLLGRQRQFHGSHHRAGQKRACTIVRKRADCAPTTRPSAAINLPLSERRRVR